MKFTASLILSCIALVSSISSAQAKYKHENGMKFYIVGSQDKTVVQPWRTIRQARIPARSHVRPRHSEENPLSSLVKHTFVHLVPVWGGTKCGSKWTEVIIPDSFTSPMGGVSFSNACAVHDKCYGDQKGRGFCDRQMYSHLKYECRRSFPAKNNHLRAECLNYSGLYYKTIRQFGILGYTAKVVTRSGRNIQKYTYRQTQTAAQWITGRKRIRFNR